MGEFDAELSNNRGHAASYVVLNVLICTFCVFCPKMPLR